MFNCQKDDAVIVNQPQDKIVSSNFKVLNLNKSDIEKNKTLTSSLQKLEDTLSVTRLANESKVVSNSGYSFIIDTGSATYIESNNGDYHSYTFTIYREDATALLENLIMSLQDNGSYRAFITSYNITLPELQTLQTGAYVDLTNKTSYEEIDAEGLTIDLFGRLTRNCITLVEEYCSKGNHPGGKETDGSACLAYAVRVIQEVCIDGTGADYDDNGGVPTEPNDDPNCSTCTGGINNDPNITQPTAQPWQGILDCLQGDLLEVDGGLQWLMDNKSQASQINNYLINQNSCSEEAQAFTIQALEALQDNDQDGEPDGEVDWDERRINGIKFDSSLPDCLESMIMDLMLGNFPYSDSMGSIELITDTFNALGVGNPLGIDFVTTYKVANISGNGSTSGSYNSTNQQFEISVTIDEDLVNNGTKLALVKTILHESIHAYLLYIKQSNPTYFNSSDEFSQLVIDYSNYTDSNDPQHIYMAGLIEDMASNVGNFVSEKYGYPSPSSSGTILAHYEAVCWSGITHLTTGNLNPLFSNNYPDPNDQQNIIKIFNTENGTASYPGYLPLINNNCN